MTTPPLRVEAAGATDDDLIIRARAGEQAAVAALWKRHAGAAYSVAYTFTSLDADDLVSEAFLRVLEALKAGKGPRAAFRPYWTMSVRNVGRQLYDREAARAHRESTSQVESAAPSGEDVVFDSFDRGAAATAFLSLPTRWQEVLWYSEVDGLRPREISEYLGIPANAVSALRVRARRALRDAWITAQLADVGAPECADAIRMMGAHARSGLSSRAKHILESHLAACPTCPAAMTEASRLSNLLLVLVPASVGVGGAAAYSATTPAPSMPQALGPEPIEAQASGAATVVRHSRTYVLAQRGMLLFVLIAGLGWLLLHGRFDDTSPHASTSPLDSASSPSSAPLSTTSPFPTPAPPKPTTPTVEQPYAPPPADDTSTDEPRIPSSPDAREQQPHVTPAPTRDVLLEMPLATLQQTDKRLYPRVSGSGATPGATIQLHDESGQTVGETRVGANGSWEARVTNGDPGTHTLYARQLLNGEESAPSAAMAYSVTEPLTLTSPSSGQQVTASRFLFSYSAPAGTVLQREIMGVTALQTLRTPATGVWREYYTIAPGEHTITLRYFDPETGEFGPTAKTSFTATE